jgi:SAM-dependent methyltransferase
VSPHRAAHWDAVHGGDPPATRSWYEDAPSTSLRLLRAVTTPDGSVVDVGAGTSHLVDALLADGYGDLTCLDVSAAALAVSRRRLGPDAGRVAWVVADILAWRPGRTWDAWHDRAVFHFLTAPGDRERYAALAARAVRPGGALVLGCFAPDGPDRCSGLPVARHDAAGLAAAFAPAFAPERAERVVHRTPAGREQPFTWAVLRRLP